PDLEPARVGGDAHAGRNRAGALRGGAPEMVAAHQSLPRYLGAERLPAGLSGVRRLRGGGSLPARRRGKNREGQMRLLGAGCLMAAGLLFAGGVAPAAQQKSPGAGPVIVLETVKGTIEFETYPDEAPKTVARIVELVKKNFYNGQRFHRAEPKFVVQIGD